VTLTVHALDHLVINVADVDASVVWYQTILGVVREDFDPGQGKPRRTSIKFGHQKINLRPVGADPIEWFTGRHATAGSDDLCFLTDSAPDAVAAHLRANGVTIEEGPVTKQGARGPIRSVYCRDPDGNLIEIASYPER
jgi:catechol 2,3-dioxygenase-like lactoylglutathione lyase family enzyme